jgi:hypothetical protein
MSFLFLEHQNGIDEDQRTSFVGESLRFHPNAKKEYLSPAFGSGNSSFNRFSSLID